CILLSPRSAHPPHPPSLPTRRSSDLRLRRRLPPRRHVGPPERRPLGMARTSRGGGGLRAHPRSDEDRHDARGRRRVDPHPNEGRSEEHTSELQSPYDLVCRLLLEKKK